MDKSNCKFVSQIRLVFHYSPTSASEFNDNENSRIPNFMNYSSILNIEI